MMTFRNQTSSLPGIVAALILVLLAGCSSRLPLERAPLPFRQAEDSFKLGHYERAAHGYRIYIDSGEVPELIPRAYFKLARSEFRLGNYDRCIATLDELERRYPDEDWRQVAELRADAEYSRGNPVSAILSWERALEKADASRKKLLRQRISDAAAKLDEETAARARSIVTRDDTRALIDAARGGAPVEQRPTAVAGLKRTPAPAAKTAATPAVVLPGQFPVGSAKVAALLPLSGQYEAYGKRSLAGIELALEGSGIALLVRDSGGEAHLARAALDEIAKMPEVVAVIGPLRSKIAESVSPRAERARLPLFSLGQNKTMTGRYVLQTAMTHEMQAKCLVDYATQTAGMRRFGVMYPRDPYGDTLAASFEAEAKRRGASVVGALAYEPGAEDFSVELLSLKRWVDGDRIDAVFIPDFAATAGVLSQTLRQARPQVGLLGGNGWNDPGALGAVADSIDGAVFIDGFFIGSQRPATQRFVNAYRASRGGEPGILEAQAYDAASVVRQVLSASPSTSRDALINGVRGLGAFEGASGTLTFGDGEVDRDLFVLKLEGRRIREVNPGEPASSPVYSIGPSSDVVGEPGLAPLP